MSESPSARKPILIWKLFEILAAAPEGLKAKDALRRVAESVTLTEYEKGTYDSGPQRFEKLVRFASITTVKAGWLVKSKGVWFATEEGLAAMKQHRTPEEFLKAARRLYIQWKKAQPSVTAPDFVELEDDEEEDDPSITFERAEEQAWAEIEKYLQNMPPYEFQELVADLLRAIGYFVSWVAPPGKDGGYDILAWNDPLGTRPPRIKVQVRRLNSTVSVDGLRAFMAVLGNDDVGLFVCTGGFTRDAEQTARTQENRKITLIDLKKLVDLWVANYSKLEDTARQRFPLRPLYFLASDT